MPLGFIILGAIVLVAAFRNTHKQLGSQLAGDFSGSGNFIYWVVAVGIIGTLGYIPAFKGPSRALMVLLIVVLLLSNKGFLTHLYDGFKSATPLYPTQSGGTSTSVPAAGTTAGEPSAPGAVPVSVTLSGGSSSGIGGTASGLGSAASGAANLLSLAL